MKKRKRGRPVKYKMPEQIPDTPENVLRAVLNTPPKKEDEWEYMKIARRQETSDNVSGA